MKIFTPNGDINIIFNNDDFLIINKPSGLVVHGGKGVKDKSLIDYLVIEFPFLKMLGENPERPAIVHRLDKEVSGLMIIPKNDEAFLCFKNLFKERRIIKNYKALVFKQINNDYGTINFPLIRSKKSGKISALPLKYKVKKNINNRDLANISLNMKAKEAITNFKVIKNYINYSFLDVNIETGRTHQIRAHLNAYGHPIVGDNLYTNKKSKLNNKKITLKRIFLEASSLAFEHKNKEYNFKIDLNLDLQNFLETLN